jgi:hypothetical protein
MQTGGSSGVPGPALRGGGNYGSVSVPAQVAAPAIPAALAGTWTGTATLASTVEPGVTLRDPITFTLVAGARTAHELNKDCVNVLTLTRATATVLTFAEPQIPTCEAGTATFTLRGPGLAYRWLDINQLAQNTAVLHRS